MRGAIPKKSKAVFLALAVLLCVLLLPFPTHVTLRTDGTRIVDGHPASGRVGVQVQGWYLDFFLFRDKWVGNITVTDGTALRYEAMGPAYDNQNNVRFTSVFCFSEENKYVFGYLFFDTQFDKFLLEENGGRDVVFSRTPHSPAELTAYFAAVREREDPVKDAPGITSESSG